MAEGRRRLNWPRQEPRHGWRVVRSRQRELVQPHVLERREHVEESRGDVLKLLRSNDIRPVHALFVPDCTQPPCQGGGVLTHAAKRQLWHGRNHRQVSQAVNHGPCREGTHTERGEAAVAQRHGVGQMWYWASQCRASR